MSKPQRRADDVRLSKLVEDVASMHVCLATNTEMIKDTREQVQKNMVVLRQVSDVLASFRVVGSCAKWIGVMAVTFTAVGVALQNGIDWWRNR